jgi:hypothetical protein
MTCPNCGHKALITPHYCAQCGWNFVAETIQMTKDSRTGETKREYLFNPVTQSKKVARMGYSWTCLLFGNWWLFIKGMWATALVAIPIQILVYFLIHHFYGENELLIIITLMIGWGTFAFYANNLYRKHLLKRGYTKTIFI